MILQEKLEEKEKEIERLKKGMEVVSDLGDKKDEAEAGAEEADENDQVPKEIDGEEQDLLAFK